MWYHRYWLVGCVWFGVWCSVTISGERREEVQEALRQLTADVYPEKSAEGQALRQAWPRRLAEQLQQANRRSSEEWQRLQSREEWEAFRLQKLQRLRQGLNIPEAPPKPRRTVVTGTIAGEGYRIEKLVYESRPGLWVSANLYLPQQRRGRPAGLILVHSHHTPKWHGELQDMGIVWAKAGAAVLVPDLLGHGERRIHPFVDEKSFPGPFRPGRQDYYFRYNLALQLYLLGETLMGWMVHDLRCGVSVLLDHAGVDEKRIGILGSVAGGGDVAAVTAAVDERIKAAVIFNFGGPEPEDPYPLPEDAEASFPYAGSGSWESTRNLIRSAGDGFLPWVIVGSIAPRGLCYAHEFSWDRQRDPVWKRLQRIWNWYGAEKQLRSAQGKGRLTGKPPESTHCTHIGAVHRQAGVYQALEAWFGLKPPEAENTQRYSAAELTCWTPQARQTLQPQPWEEWLPRYAALQEPRQPSDKPLPNAEVLWQRWCQQHKQPVSAVPTSQVVRQQPWPGGVAHWVLLRNLDGMPIPVLFLSPPQADWQGHVVLVVCSQGKASFLKEKAAGIARLLQRGIAVCLVDVRDTGETATSRTPGRTSASTSHAATALMLGMAVEEFRLFDLLAVYHWLRRAVGADLRLNRKVERLALWGENLAPCQPADMLVAVPWDAPQLPPFADPSGPRLALMLSGVCSDVEAVYAAGDLATYRSVLESPFVYLPLAAIRPGLLRRESEGTDRDTPALALLSRARALRLEALVNSRNQAYSQKELGSLLSPLAKQRPASKPDFPARFVVQSDRSSAEVIADWLVRCLTP
jgi:dienelactone hydrolase